MKMSSLTVVPVERDLGWTVWNLLLDEKGGPRHAGGAPGSSIVNADITTGELSFNPPHYVFGQFSRFIRPGAKRIACTSNNDNFIATAFLNPDGKIAVVVDNLGDRETFFQVWIRGKVVRYSSPANAVITVVLQPAA
jgi:glucosylceramidase